METVNERIALMAKEEMEAMEMEQDNALPGSAPSLNADAFWDEFDESAPRQSSSHRSIDSELRLWGGVSRPCRTANPIHAMAGLKHDYPRVFKLSKI